MQLANKTTTCGQHFALTSIIADRAFAHQASHRTILCLPLQATYRTRVLLAKYRQFTRACLRWPKQVTPRTVFVLANTGNPQDQQDRDTRRNMKYERDTAVAQLVLGMCRETTGSQVNQVVVYSYQSVISHDWINEQYQVNQVIPSISCGIQFVSRAVARHLHFQMH